MEELILDLQFFANAGDVVNATANMTNAYTGVETPRSQNNGDATYMADELKSYYDTELLENTSVELFYAQFGRKQPLPKGRKGTVEWRKWNTFPRADQLVEAVIPAGKPFGMSSLTGSIDQYGIYTTISDKLEMQSYDDVIAGASKEMGRSAAETQEALIRNALYVGSNVMYCDEITLATGAYHASVSDWGALNYGATYGCPLTPEMINKAVTILKKARAPKINNRYYAVIHPSVAHDLRNSDGWLEPHKYAAPEQIFNGEIGELHGVRFIEDAFAPVIKGEDLASDSRTLTINNQSGYSGAITSVAFDGGTVANGALVGRYININGVSAKITANTTNSLTFASTNFGTITDNTVIYPGEGGAADQAIYATYFFGEEAFGIIEPDGRSLQMIIHDKDEIGGPLNQFSTIGYKFETNGATILYQERMLRVMSASSFSDVDDTNL